jgi:hypothetical protein
MEVILCKTLAEFLLRSMDKIKSVEELLKAAIETLLAASNSTSSVVLLPQERAEKFTNWARSHRIETPPLSNEAISRESIYREREDSQR